MQELLLLWRWSTLVQVTSDFIIAVFFIALTLSLRRRELHPWLAAWLFDLGALVVTITYWLLRPESRFTAIVASVGYVFCKTMFVGLLVAGALHFLGRPLRVRSYLMQGVATAAFAIVTALSIHSTDQLGVIQETAVATILGAGALHLARRSGFGWVAIGFALRAALATSAIITYGLQWRYGAPVPGSMLSYFVAAHSSLDAGAEWVIALGCLLATYHLIQHELTVSNAELRDARDQMQQMLHRDQLTGMGNRRALPPVMAAARHTGATVLFFDLDDFKRINDEQGHNAGDACLVRFARTLRESFRDGDQVIRYAGDEFIVVAIEQAPAAIGERIERVRERLSQPDQATPAIRFSVGQAVLPPGGDPEATLHDADLAMYEAKASIRSRSAG